MKTIHINPNIGLLIMRISIGALMLLHGIPKLMHGTEFIQQLLVSKGFPAFIAYGVYLGEIVAPLVIMIGFRTKLASLVFAFNTIVIIYLLHAHEIFAFGQYGGLKLELIYLYLFGSVALFFTGAGKIALSSKNKWD